jgi:hypothetical protein
LFSPTARVLQIVYKIIGKVANFVGFDYSGSKSVMSPPGTLEEEHDEKG